MLFILFQFSLYVKMHMIFSYFFEYHVNKITFTERSYYKNRINILLEELLLLQKTEFFTRFPNEYIQGNIKTKYGISRKFYITYILIDKYRSYEDYSWITIRKVLDFYGYKTHRNKPKAFHEILDVLEYMVNNKMIEVKQDFDSISYDTGIEIKINPDNFDFKNDFSKLTSTQFDFIMMNESSINRENILIAFLYINSYIYIRQRDKNGNELLSKPQDKPEAFYRSLETMSKDLSMSKDTINQCIQYLTSSIGDKEPLLIKQEVGSVQPDPKKPPKNVPNIYVLNNERYEQEIEWAIEKMLEIYKVDSFGEIKGGNKN